MRRALEARLELQGRKNLLDSAFRPIEAAVNDAAQAPGLVRKLLARRQGDVRDLEQRSVHVAGVDVVAGCTDEPVQERRAEDALELGQRPGQDERLGVRVVRLERVRVRLEEAAADEDVGDEPAQSLIAREPAEQLSTYGQR